MYYKYRYILCALHAYIRKMMDTSSREGQEAPLLGPQSMQMAPSTPMPHTGETTNMFMCLCVCVWCLCACVCTHI